MRDRVGHISYLEIRAVEALLIIDVPFGSLCDLRHRLNRLHGIFACGSLAREHNCAGAVVNCVCNIRDLGSGRTGVGYHRLKHLGRGDNALAEHTALGDKLLLNCGQMLKGYLDAHISSRHHDSVAALAYLLDIVDSRLIFYLRDKLDVLGPYLAHIALYVYQILLAGNEGAGDVVHGIFHAPLDVLLILLGKIGLLHYLAGKAHALSIRKLAAADDLTFDIRALYFFNPEGQKPVVEKYRVSYRELFGES